MRKRWFCICNRIHPPSHNHHPPSPSLPSPSMQAQQLFATPPLSRHDTLPPYSPIVHDIFSLKLPTCSSKTKRVTGGSSSGTQVKRAHTRSCPESDRTKSIVKLISPAESKEEDFLDTWRSVGRCGPVIFWSDRGG